MKPSVKGVMMLIAKYHPEMGGAELQARLLCRELYEHGVKALIVTRNYHRGLAKEVVDETLVYRSPTFGKIRILNSFFYILWCVAIIAMQRRRIGIIHCHQSYSPMTAGVIAGRLLKIPVIVKITASNEYGEVKELRRLPFFKFRQRLLKKVKVFLAVNRDVIEELTTLDIPRERCVLMPNGVAVPTEIGLDPEVKKRHRDISEIKGEEKVLVYSGRLSAEKGLATLIKAWKVVDQRYTAPHLLLLLGEGGAQRNIEADIKRLVVELELSASVKFLGRVERVTQYLLAADAFTLLSVSEGMSNSLLEAMACGLPSVLSDIPGNRMLVTHAREGILVGVGDVAATAEGILMLFEDVDKALAMGHEAREKIKKEFDIALIARKILDVYEKVSGDL